MNAQWAIRPDAYAAPADFSAARVRGDVQPWLQGLSAQSAAYADVLQWRRAYRAIVAAGGWPSLEMGVVLREGATGSGVDALWRRLSIEGYAANTEGDADLFDASLADALTKFQAAHDLAADGVCRAGNDCDAQCSGAAKTPPDRAEYGAAAPRRRRASK